MTTILLDEDGFLDVCYITEEIGFGSVAHI